MVLLSFGRYGGFYLRRGFSTRLCLGWFAITFIPSDDELLLDAINEKLGKTAK